MPHDLGSPRDFGLEIDNDPILDPDSVAENAAILGQDNDVIENEYGEDLDVIDNVFDGPDAEVGMNLGETDNIADDQALAELMNYLQMMQPEYSVTPRDLSDLVDNNIITVAEARAYLEGKGVLAG